MPLSATMPQCVLCISLFVETPRKLQNCWTCFSWLQAVHCCMLCIDSITLVCSVTLAKEFGMNAHREQKLLVLPQTHWTGTKRQYEQRRLLQERDLLLLAVVWNISAMPAVYIHTELPQSCTDGEWVTRQLVLVLPPLLCSAAVPSNSANIYTHIRAHSCWLQLWHWKTK